MSAEQVTGDDYPYGRQPPAVLRVRELQQTRTPFMPRLWPWLLRIGAVGIVVVLIIAAPIGIVGYRAGRQAAMIAELEQLGCRVTYSFDRTDGTTLDTLQGLFGHNGFADVSQVSAENISPNDAARIAEICSRFEHLTSFTIVSNSFRFDQIASWKHLDELSLLSIHSTSITDNDLARVAKMPNLITLALTSPHISDAGVQQLANLPLLDNLELHSVQLTGSAPANSGGFPKLQRLAIHDAPRLNDQAIIKLGPMPDLHSLELGGTQIGDAAIAHAAKSGKLTNVFLAHTQITDAALAHLAKCVGLSNVDLADTQVTDAGIVQLASCALSGLDLSGTSVTGKGFGALSGKDLVLNLDRTDVNDANLPEVLQIPALITLSLQDTKITGATFPRHVTGGGSGASFPPPATGPGGRLTVDLSGAALTAQGFAALAKTNVTDLTLSRTGLTDQQLMLFAGNDQINMLDITQTKVTANGLVAFYEARKQRLTAAGRQESLYVISDFADIAEQYLPEVPGGAPDEPAEQPPGQEPAQSPPPEAPM
jgi:Leucine-rich repeat (LRR) protein